MKPSRPLYRSANRSSSSSANPNASILNCCAGSLVSSCHKSGFRKTSLLAVSGFIPIGAQSSERKSGDGNVPGKTSALAYGFGAKNKTAFMTKLIASGTSRFDNASYWRKSEDKKSPLATSAKDRTRHKPRYAPISKRAGDITACFISLVGQMIPITRKKVSSANPGHVLESGAKAPLASPRLRFLCIKESFSTNDSADSMGKDRLRENKWDTRGDTSLTRGSGDDVMNKIWSTRTLVRFCHHAQ